MSGAGAAIRGARLNPRGVEALYLALSIVTAVNEANQGLAFKIHPCVLCCYDVDCDDIADLRTEAGRAAHSVKLEDMACAWFPFLFDGKEPPSWGHRQGGDGRRCGGHSGANFAPETFTDADRNLVLWRWSDRRPHRVRSTIQPGRLPKDQLSWRRHAATDSYGNPTNAWLLYQPPVTGHRASASVPCQEGASPSWAYRPSLKLKVTASSRGGVGSNRRRRSNPYGGTRTRFGRAVWRAVPGLDPGWKGEAQTRASGEPATLRVGAKAIVGSGKVVGDRELRRQGR